MIAARSCLSVLEREAPGLGRPLDAVVLVPGPHVRSRQPKDVSRRFAVLGLRQLCQLGDGFLIASKGKQHASQIEPGQPKRWLTLQRLPVVVGRRLELALALEDLAEIVARLHVGGIDE